MAAKIVFLCLAVLLVAQVALGRDLSRVSRDTADTTKKTEDAAKAVDELINSMKTSLSDILTNIQSNDVVKDLSATITKFGDQIQEQGQKVISDIQKKSSTTAN